MRKLHTLLICVYDLVKKLLLVFDHPMHLSALSVECRGQSIEIARKYHWMAAMALAICTYINYQILSDCYH